MPYEIKGETKKYIAISGGAVICIRLIAAISLQFGKALAGEDKLPENSSAASEIVVVPGSLATRTEEPSTEEDQEAIIEILVDALVDKLALAD